MTGTMELLFNKKLKTPHNISLINEDILDLQLLLGEG